MTDSETALLEELNADLPQGIDWKHGAIEYLRNLIRGEGSHNELYHLTSPIWEDLTFSLSSARCMVS